MFLNRFYWICYVNCIVSVLYIIFLTIVNILICGTSHLQKLQKPAKPALREVRKYVKEPRGGQKLTWIKMIEKDLERARVMVAKEDGTIFIATDEYLANNRPLWQSVVSRAMLN